MLFFGATGEAAPKRPRHAWPFFTAYVEHFISADGRVIDFSDSAVTTSEGQSYALFFALVANDRGLFDRVLKWTENNLAKGSLERNLPSTRWGPDSHNHWGVLDPNPASDADLWIGYTLVEAGRLWGHSPYGLLGRAVLANVVKAEVSDLPGLGPMLLPAPVGFLHDKDTWRLNPSYLPLQVLRGLAAAEVPGPWKGILENTLRLLKARGAQGFADDWVAYHRTSGFITDPVKGSIGSYDAIRVYLWAALLSDEEEHKAELNGLLHGPLDHWREFGVVPERVDVTKAHGQYSRGPVGFAAVLLPRLEADPAALAALTKQIEDERNGKLYGRPPRYYDQNLLLFARGYCEHQYRFDGGGRLLVAWKKKD